MDLMCSQMSYKSSSPDIFSMVLKIKVIYLKWIAFLILNKNQTKLTSFLLHKLLGYKFLREMKTIKNKCGMLPLNMRSFLIMCEIYIKSDKISIVQYKSCKTCNQTHMPIRIEKLDVILSFYMM